MNTPLITWACIVGLFLIILLVNIIHSAYVNGRGKHKLVSLGSEREELYIPGDPDPRKTSDYDYDDSAYL